MKKTQLVTMGLSLVLASQTFLGPPLALADDKVPEPGQAQVQEAAAKLEMCQISSPTSAKKNGQVHISFTIKNSGSAPAKDIQVQAKPQDEKTLLAQAETTITESKLEPGQEISIDFVFQVSSDAKAKDQTIDLDLGYIDGGTGQEKSDTKNLGLAVQEAKAPEAPSMSADMDMGSLAGAGGGMSLGGGGGAGGPDEASSANMPKIIISNYSFEPRIVQAGRDFTLQMDIYNTNKSKDVRNIKVSLTADAAEAMGTQAEIPGGDMAALSGGGGAASSAFTPVGSSNTFYIESIGPRKTAHKEVTFSTMPDMAAKTYTLAANFEYEDSKGQTFRSSELIGIPVVQKSEITVSQVQVDDYMSLGLDSPLSMDFFNTGRSPLTNVMVQVKGNFEADINTFFVGNFAPGAQESYMVSLTPTQEGKQKGEVVIQYEDAAGETQEIIQPFSVEVGEMDPMMDEDMDLDDDTSPGWAKPLAVILVIGIIVGVGLLVWKKRKDGSQEDQDLDL